MKYLILPIILSIYFEFFGQYIIGKFNRKNITIGFGIGLVAFLAITYVTTSLLTFSNCHFSIIFTIYSLIIIGSVVMIIKDKKHTKYKFGFYHLVLLFLIIIFTYYSYNTALGELHGFDTTHYLNLVTSNAEWDYLNNQTVLFGNIKSGAIPSTYSFQTFYYFASFVTYVATTILKVYPGTIYIWTFQILYYFLFFSLIINTYEKLNNKKNILFILLSVLLLGFYYCRLYFSTAFGFIGNVYRIVMIGYISYFVYEYFQDDSETNLLFVCVGMLGACSVSSSCTFIVIIIGFALFVSRRFHNDKILKYYALVYLIPLINILITLTNNLLITLSMSLTISFMLFLFGKQIYQIISKYKLNKWIIGALFLFMVVMSYFVTKNVFSTEIFFNNTSEIADMTINYFNLNNIPIIRLIYVLLFFFGLVILLVRNKRDNNIYVMLVIFVVFLSPITCSYYYSINFVYHRTFDAVINPFTYVYVLYMAFDLIKNTKVQYTIQIALLSILVLNIDFLKPIYNRESFIPGNDYNYIYKMQNYEIDIIENLREDIKNCNVDRPKIVTNNILTQSMIPQGNYIYGRNNSINEEWTYSEYQVYAIFYKEEGYNGFYQPKDADTENVETYIKNAEIDYLVLDKEQAYLDKVTGEWKPLMYKVNEFKFPYYENEKYVIYHFERD